MVRSLNVNDQANNFLNAHAVTALHQGKRLSILSLPLSPLELHGTEGKFNV